MNVLFQEFKFFVRLSNYVDVLWSCKSCSMCALLRWNYSQRSIVFCVHQSHEVWPSGLDEPEISGSGIQFPQHWSCVKSLGQALNPHYLWLPSNNGYLVQRTKVGSPVATAFRTNLDGGKINSDEYGPDTWMLNRYLYIYLYLQYRYIKLKMKGHKNPAKWCCKIWTYELKMKGHKKPVI